MFRLTGALSEQEFLHHVVQRSGQNLLECLQCGKCTGGCPIASEKVSGPRRLIAEILSGMRNEALKNPTWWYCVSCGTCMTRCPVDINMYQVATALCELAQEGGIAPSERDIHLFEELFLKSVEKYGRVKELRTVAAYNVITKNPLKDMDKAVTLMRKGAFSPLEILSGWAKDRKVSRIFALARRTSEGGHE
ncbi:MAG: 4Fe-4S dicluster domain-containing protein [Desulfomonile tiedjei]|uniref:4Fe-4S dicluster domain-containing protein n=1 Tax=Desulfomonile tiedjei TaxID=2358 RepID=A0A9D6V199_9BACT|nr:4Fe-4S dicluster domain-containing protein [Desulfomonile tiedjei]